MELVVTQALKNAGCDEVVLAINYQPKAGIIILLWCTSTPGDLSPCTACAPCLLNRAYMHLHDTSKERGWPCAGDDGFPQGVGNKAGHQDHLLSGDPWAPRAVLYTHRVADQMSHPLMSLVRMHL